MELNPNRESQFQQLHFLRNFLLHSSQQTQPLDPDTLSLNINPDSAERGTHKRIRHERPKIDEEQLALLCIVEEVGEVGVRQKQVLGLWNKSHRRRELNSRIRHETLQPVIVIILIC